MTCQYSSVQSLSRVWLSATPWTVACLASLSITNSRSPSPTPGVHPNSFPLSRWLVTAVQMPFPRSLMRPKSSLEDSWPEDGRNKKSERHGFNPGFHIFCWLLNLAELSLIYKSEDRCLYHMVALNMIKDQKISVGEVLVTQLCPTLCHPMDCSLPGSSVHGILQARILEWVSIPFSRGSSWPRDQTRVSCIPDSVGEDEEKRKALCTINGIVKRNNHYEKQYGGSSKN